MDGLLADQKRAVREIITAGPLVYVPGPPGTGKSYIVGAIRNFYVNGKRAKVTLLSPRCLALLEWQKRFPGAKTFQSYVCNCDMQKVLHRLKKNPEYYRPMRPVGLEVWIIDEVVVLSARELDFFRQVVAEVATGPTKIILIGDNAQLESVDPRFCLYSNYFSPPKQGGQVKLKVVHGPSLIVRTDLQEHRDVILSLRGAVDPSKPPILAACVLEDISTRSPPAWATTALASNVFRLMTTHRGVAEQQEAMMTQANLANIPVLRIKPSGRGLGSADDKYIKTRRLIANRNAIFTDNVTIDGVKFANGQTVVVVSWGGVEDEAPPHDPPTLNVRAGGDSKFCVWVQRPDSSSADTLRRVRPVTANGVLQYPLSLAAVLTGNKVQGITANRGDKFVIFLSPRIDPGFLIVALSRMHIPADETIADYVYIYNLPRGAVVEACKRLQTWWPFFKRYMSPPAGAAHRAIQHTGGGRQAAKRRKVFV